MTASPTADPAAHQGVHTCRMQGVGWGLCCPPSSFLHYALSLHVAVAPCFCVNFGYSGENMVPLPVPSAAFLLTQLALGSRIASLDTSTPTPYPALVHTQASRPGLPLSQWLVSTVFLMWFSSFRLPHCPQVRGYS